MLFYQWFVLFPTSNILSKDNVLLALGGEDVKSFSPRCITGTDLQGRSQTSYTTPCNGVLSQGAQIGGLWVFADHTRKNNA